MTELFEDNALKIRYILIIVFLFAVGTFAAFFPGWEWFTVIMYVVGFVVLGVVSILVIIRERADYIREETDRLDAQRKLYETVMRLDGEARYALGLTRAPSEVSVKINKTATEGNELSLTWKKIPIAPYKLKVVAQAVLNGEGFTYRKWAGDGKLLTDDEWRAAHDKMVELGMLEQLTTDPRGGFQWTGLGIDVMEQVVRETL